MTTRRTIQEIFQSRRTTAPTNAEIKAVLDLDDEDFEGIESKAAELLASIPEDVPPMFAIYVLATALKEAAIAISAEYGENEITQAIGKTALPCLFAGLTRQQAG